MSATFLGGTSGDSDRPDGPRVSRFELERRWSAVRSAMDDSDVDVLLAQASNDWFGGNVRYLSDLTPAHGVTITVAFPREDNMTVVRHGPPGDFATPAASDGSTRGISRFLTTPSFSALSNTDQDETALIAEALRPFATGTIGLLAKQQISSATLDSLRDAYPKAKLVDSTALLDSVRTVKSAEEQDFIRVTAALQDTAMQRALEFIRPGVTEREISSYLQSVTSALGSDQGVFLCGSAPAGEPAVLRMLRDETRSLRVGDMVHILLETNGPGGFYTHMVRSAVLGPVPQQVSEELEVALGAQRHTMDMLTPGAVPSEVWQAHNEYMREHGRPEEHRIYCHSQGCDMNERPVLSAKEKMPIQIGMNIGCHPSYVYDGMFMWVCSNFLIGQDGAEPLHKLSTDLVER